MDAKSASAYLQEDLESIKGRYAPLLQARANVSKWRTLFIMAATLLMLIVLAVCALMCVACCRKRRERDEYTSV